MVSDDVGGYHGRAELGLLRGRGPGGERVCEVWLVGGLGGGWGEGGGGVVRPSSPRPPRRQHQGSMPGPVSGKTARTI